VMPASDAQPGLPAFQLEVARLFFALPASKGFLLAGGAALLAQHGLVPARRRRPPPPRTGSPPRHLRCWPATAPGSRDHRPGRLRRPVRQRLRPLPQRPARAPVLRPGPRKRLAHRDRRHRGRMPPSRRPPRHRRSQVGPGRRRGRPHPPRGDQQRRLRGVLAIPPRTRAPETLPRHQTGPVRTRSLNRYLTSEELHPIAFPSPTGTLGLPAR